jgi:hypothetical protein
MTPKIAKPFFLAALVLVSLAFTVAPALAAISPTVTIKPVGVVTSITAKVSGAVNPNGGLNTIWDFQYSKDPETEGWTPSALSGIALAAEEVEGTLEGLQPNASYEVRLVATNEESGEGVSAEPNPKFETKPAPPAIESESASNIKAGEARLEGVVNPNNEATECHFQYEAEEPLLKAPTTALCEPASFPASFGGQGVGLNTATVGGLEADKTYYYRVVAKNAAGETKGTAVEPIKHFETALPPETPQATEAKPIAANEATLNGLLNPGGARSKEPGAYEFAYRQSATECQGGAAGEEKKTPAAAAPGLEKDAPAQAAVTGLLPGTQYTFCLLASNDVGEPSAASLPVTFTTQAQAPALSGEYADGLTASTATLHVTVNPNGAEVTACKFEYGTSTSYEHSEPCAQQPGAGTAEAFLTQSLTGLSENITYHWRIVAANAAGTTTGVDHSFVYSTTGEGLPDNRAYEMVTPPQKDGSEVGAVVFHSPDISDDGSRVIAMSIQCLPVAEACTGSKHSSNGDPYSFSRTNEGEQCKPSPAPCWVTAPLAPPSTKYNENAAFTYGANDGDALFSIETPPGAEDDWYVRQSDGSIQHIGPITQPSLGTSNEGEFTSGPILSTADYSHLVWMGSAASSWPSLSEDTQHTVYEYLGADNAQPFLVGVNGPEGSTSLISACGTGLGSEQTTYQGALSADGRTVFFTVNYQNKVANYQNHETGCFGSGSNKELEVPVGEIYARVDGELPEAHTVAVSEPQAPQGLEQGPRAECEEAECVSNTSASVEAAAIAAHEPGPWRAAHYEAASSDGSRVVFTSTQQLTDGASEDPNTSDTASSCIGTTPGASGCNLYEFEGATAAHSSERHLIDVSAGDASGLPEVQEVVALSPDGSHVYFKANGVLASGASPGHLVNGEGKSNLYVYERDASYPNGHIAFIASVSEQLRGSANVTPDGRFLVFTSRADLTPDDTRTNGAKQVFRYDADPTAQEEAAHVPRLVRISIGNDGVNDNGNAGTGAAEIARPGPCANQLKAPHAGPPCSNPTMSDDGQYVFFESPVGLTPQALNDVPTGSTTGEGTFAENVYEYRAGHVYLIGSAGSKLRTPPYGGIPTLLGVSGDGANVFFVTEDALVPTDTDTQFDIYDARICTAESPCVKPPPPASPPCLGEACHGIPAAAPSLLTPGTVSFNGAGNLVSAAPAVKQKSLTRAQKLAKALTSCRKKYKHSRKRRAACEKQADRAYRATAKKATHGRRAGR